MSVMKGFQETCAVLAEKATKLSLGNDMPVQDRIAMRIRSLALPSKRRSVTEVVATAEAGGNFEPEFSAYEVRQLINNLRCQLAVSESENKLLKQISELGDVRNANPALPDQITDTSRQSLIQMKPETCPIDIVALAVGAARVDAKGLLPFSIDECDTFSQYAILASNLATEMQNLMAEDGFPGVWAYDVMEPYGEYLAKKMMKEGSLDMNKHLPILGLLIHTMFNESKADWEAVASLVKDVTGYVPK